MKSFKLYMVDENDTLILLSDFEEGREINNMMTMNENITEQEHDRYDFSFNIVDRPSVFLNENFHLSEELRIGRELRLYLDGNDYSESSPNDEYISFIIIQVAPQLNKENNLYNITCQDYASYVWSRNNSGLVFDSLIDEEYNDVLSLNSNIFNISNYLLIRGSISPPLSYEGAGYTGAQVVTGEYEQTITNLTVSSRV